MNSIHNGTGTGLWPGVAGLIAAFVVAGCSDREPSGVDHPGSEKTTMTRALETGANLLQDVEPLEPFNIYLVGFHPMKADPLHQMEAHHYCNQLSEDLSQCVLFDGDSAGSRLTGVEFIISESLFEALPEEEKPYWHPHNYEILSGQLVAPGIPAVAEKELMRRKINSYGKTWHLRYGNSLTTGLEAELPMGDPMLAWSLNRDGEAIPGLVEQRDRRMDLSTEKKRKEREDLLPLANPQSGVNALQDAFDTSTTAIPGVVDSAQERRKELDGQAPNGQNLNREAD